MSNLTSLIAEISTTAFSQFIQSTTVADFLDKSIDSWLKEGDLSATGLYNPANARGVTAHWTNILQTNLLMVNRRKGTGKNMDVRGSNFQTIDQLSSILNDVMYLPNIEGIPIFPSKIVTKKQMDVSQRTVITQEGQHKDVRIDNAVPRLRTWEITGYLQSLIPALDAYSIVKTTIKEQSKMMQKYMDTRRPVWFKSHLGEFIQVLVTNYEEQATPENMNTFAITVSLIEFKPLKFKNVAATINTARAIEA